MSENQNLILSKRANRSTIRRFIKRAESSFDNNYQEIHKKEEITYSDIQLLYGSIWDFFIKLKKKYYFEYCRLFDNLPFISGTSFSRQLFEKDNGLEIGLCPYEYSSNQKHCFPDFSRIRKNFISSLSPHECANSIKESDREKALNCFSVDGQNLTGEKEIVLACSNLAVIIGISEIKDEILFEEISGAFSDICSRFQNIKTAFLLRKYVEILNHFRHDCAHYALTIKCRNNAYADREYYESLSPSSRENIYRDISLVATSLELMSENVSIIIRDSVSNKHLKTSPFDLNEEINKLRAMYRFELRYRNKEIRNLTTRFDATRKIDTVPDLFSLVLFNIMNNAIIYSYFGTVIDIELRPQGPHAQDFELVITDYGAPIELSERPYDLSYRSPQVATKYIGDGIGLFSSKQICQSLGLTISHTCNLISEFNYPLLRAARVRNIDLERIVGTPKYFMLTQSEQAYSSTLSKSNESAQDMAKAEILNKIELPVYKVSFIIKGLKERG